MKNKSVKKIVMLLCLMLITVMTTSCMGRVSSVATPESFVCDGSVVDFDFSFRLLNEANDLDVRVRNDANGGDTVLTRISDYTLSATNNDFSQGGRITTVSTFASGNMLIARRETSRTQPVNLIQGQALPAENVETTLDRRALVEQDIDAKLGYYISVPFGDPTSARDLVLPSSVDRKGKVLGFDSTTGSVTAVAGLPASSASVSTFMETLLDDTTAAQAMDTLSGKATFNVKAAAYGAIGDSDRAGGGTDDTTAIKAAIAAASASLGAAALGTGTFPEGETGAEVYFPPGAYMVTDPPIVPEGITLVGEGPFASTIYNGDTTGKACVKFAEVDRGGAGAIFGGAEDIGFVGNASSGYGIQVVSGTNAQRVYMKFDNIIVRDHGSSGIFIELLSGGGSWNDCYIYNNKGEGVEFETGSTTTVQRFVNCQFRVNDGNGVNVDGVGHSFVNCVFESNIGNGARIDGQSHTFFQAYFENNQRNFSPDVNQSTQLLINGARECAFYSTFINGNDGMIQISSAGNNNHFDNTRFANNFGRQNMLIDSGCTLNRVIFSHSTVQHDVNNLGGSSNIIFDHNDITVANTATIKGIITAAGGEIRRAASNASLIITGGINGSAGGRVTYYGQSHATKPNTIETVGKVVSTLVTFTDSDTTPSVETGNYFNTNTTGITVTRFDDCIAGQEFTIVSKGAIVFDTSSASRLIGSSADITTATGDLTMWICETGGTTSSVCRLKGFVDISQDNSSNATGLYGQ